MLKGHLSKRRPFIIDNTSFIILLKRKIIIKSSVTMSELRKKMIMDMKLKGLSIGTIKRYTECVINFAKFYNKSLKFLGEEEIKKYLYHSITEKRLKKATVRMHYSALKFLYSITLDRPNEIRKIPRMKEDKSLPLVLSSHEVNKYLK